MGATSDSNWSFGIFGASCASAVGAGFASYAAAGGDFASGCAHAARSPKASSTMNRPAIRLLAEWLLNVDR
jgi:hypothetical protein